MLLLQMLVCLVIVNEMLKSMEQSAGEAGDPMGAPRCCKMRVLPTLK